MSDEMNKLRETAAEASRRRQYLERERRGAGEAAKAAAESDFDAPVRVAREIERDAQKALDAALVDAAAVNPLVGKRVFKLGSPATFRHSATANVNGVVDVWKPGQTAATSYQPKNGDLYVRYLKKDGTPGQRIDRMHSEKLPYGWQFAEAGK